MSTWAKSPQYQGMPHQQYLQTDEGKRSTQFFQRDDQWRRGVAQAGFQQGQAQSQQNPYATSTPYKKNPAGDFAAYSPQQNAQRFGNTTLNQSYSPGSSPYSQAPQMPTSPTDGNWANYATQNRPAPFTARYGQPDGSFSDSPNYNQRDAFVQALNNQQTPYMTGQRSGPPQYDVGAAWNQAGQMVQQGFQNPFAPNLAAQAQPQQGPLPSLAAQAFPPQYLTMAPPQQAPQQGGLADIQRRLSNATTQDQLLEINRDGRALMQQQSPARTTGAPAAGIRARGPGDPPERAAPRTRYQQEIDRMKAQGAYGPARPLSANEQQLADAVRRSRSWQEDAARSRDAMYAERGHNRANRGQTPYSGGLIRNAGSDRLGSWMASRRAENKRLAADAFQKAKTPEEKMQAFRFPQNYGIYT